MIGIVATLKVVEGKNEAFEAVFTELSAAVRANEPGCLLYQLTRSRSEPQTYVVMEMYKDQAAVDAHRTTPHFTASGPKMAGLTAGRPEVQVLDAIG